MGLLSKFLYSIAWGKYGKNSNSGRNLSGIVFKNDENHKFSATDAGSSRVFFSEKEAPHFLERVLFRDE